jgi:hypothetical protein
MPRPTLGARRCKACGAFGHITGPDGDCSRTAIAVAGVLEEGATIADAARLLNLAYANVYRAVQRRRAWTEPTADQLHAHRRVVIRRRASLGEWFAGVHVDNAGQWAVLEWPDLSGPPHIDPGGAEHEEIADPERWCAVGWGERRRA